MKRLVMAVLALATGAVGAATFERARPVWPAASDGLPNENVRFAATFEADGHPLVLKATGATQYKIRLDGETVGWGPARAPEGWARVSEIPLQAEKGRHELVFEVTAYNIKEFYCNIPQPGFLQAELVDADGNVLVATGKDGAFRAALISARHRVTARFSSQRGFVECWTLPEKNEKTLALAERSEKRLAERRAPEPDLSVLAPMRLVAEQKVRFDPDTRTQDWFFVKDEYEQIGLGYPLTNHVWDAYRHAQKFVALEKIRPVADAPVGRVSEGVRLRYDLSADLTGFVGMKVKVTKPGKLWLDWSELLVNGKVNSFKMRNADISVWEFTEPGEYAIETFEPYALRYLEATAEEGVFEISSPVLRRLESPEAATAKLPRTGDAELDEILAAAKRTLAENTLDTFMDCPGRERAAWLCDSYFSAKGFFALTGSTKVEKDFLENWLLPDSFGDLPEGMLPMTYPSSATTGRFIPNWAMWYVLQLEDYLKRSGDRAFVDAMKPRMAKLLKFFRQYRNSDGLLEKLPSWVFIEWSAANEYVQDVNYPANMTWAGVLEAFGRMYGDAKAAAEAAKVRKAVFAQSFDGEFFRDHARRWADGSLTVMPERTETCQNYALYFRFGDRQALGEWYETVVNRLGGARSVGEFAEISRSTPFIGCALRVLALSELGETEALKRDVKAFFLEQARRTGTLWETEREVNSNCHGFAGVVADILLRLQSVNCTPPAAFRSFKPVIAPGKVKVCMDWDDSCFTDFRLTELCRKYGAKATFNITPREHTDNCYMQLMTTERNGTTYHFRRRHNFDPATAISIPYLTSADFPKCYAGFRIAAHLNMRYGDTPEDLAFSRRLMEEFLSIAPDVTGQDGFGIVWSGGRKSPGIVMMAKELGFRYCRGANAYEKPGEWGRWEVQPTTYWSEPPEKFWEWYELAKKRGDVFWFWGHTQDLGYDDAIWARLEGIIRRISEDPDAEWIDVGDLVEEGWEDWTE